MRVATEAARRWAGGAGMVPNELHNAGKLAVVGIAAPVTADALALAVADAAAGVGPSIPGSPPLGDGERSMVATFAKWDRWAARRPRRREVWSA